MLEQTLHTVPFLADAAPTGGGIFSLLPMLLLIAGMWFLLIAPQRKKQKKHAAMIQTLGSGDEIITNSGIYGTITNIKDDRFVVKISDNTKIEINKSFVQAKVDYAAEAK